MAYICDKAHSVFGCCPHCNGIAGFWVFKFYKTGVGATKNMGIKNITAGFTLHWFVLTRPAVKTKSTGV